MPSESSKFQANPKRHNVLLSRGMYPGLFRKASFGSYYCWPRRLATLHTVSISVARVATEELRTICCPSRNQLINNAGLPPYNLQAFSARCTNITLEDRHIIYFLPLTRSFGTPQFPRPHQLEFLLISLHLRNGPTR